ncbi:PQQ-dependent sugar dehydrogenase [Tahibacter amnicola]|uniref:PQQ-dependent sugar dehydrogenase n=1 Tax=Tahibacter amnicola TaxID=2976241 RepID=UPI003CCD92C2
MRPTFAGKKSGVCGGDSLPAPLRLASAVILAAASLAACGRVAQPLSESTGAHPKLPPPSHSVIPVIDIAPATGWAADQTPIAATGLRVRAYARDLDHPRWLLVLPNGDVLVAESNAPPDSRATKGIKGAVMKAVMRRAGAGVPSPNRITLLRDADGDGVAEQRHAFARGLNSPFGMALIDQTLYIANADALVRVPYHDGDVTAVSAAEMVVPLPHGPGPLNHHWTKSLVASADGKRLYVGVGSNSNVAEGGMDKEVNRAAVLQIDPEQRNVRIFASGLRNPVGLDFEPVTGDLWTVVNERDELGNDLVPDYLTHVVENAFYGWPYSYFGDHVDARVEPQRPDLVASARVPDYALGAHTASLGLAFATAHTLPARYHAGAFIGQHGSWNRRPPVGYRVIFVPFANGRPSGSPTVVLDGFLDAQGNARGRPAGVHLARDGALLVADDVGNVIWRVDTDPAAP